MANPRSQRMAHQGPRSSRHLSWLRTTLSFALTHAGNVAQFTTSPALLLLVEAGLWGMVGLPTPVAGGAEVNTRRLVVG